MHPREYVRRESTAATVIPQHVDHITQVQLANARLDSVLVTA